VSGSSAAWKPTPCAMASRSLAASRCALLAALAARRGARPPQTRAAASPRHGRPCRSHRATYTAPSPAQALRGRGQRDTKADQEHSPDRACQDPSALAAHHVHRRVAGTRTDRDLLQARPRTQRRAGPLRDEVADAPGRRPRFQQARRAGRAGARLPGSAPTLLGDRAARLLLHNTFVPRMPPEQRALLGTERGRAAGAGVAARRRRHRRARSAPPGGAPAGGAAGARARARQPARGAAPGRRRWAPPRRTARLAPPARPAQQLSQIWQGCTAGADALAAQRRPHEPQTWACKKGVRMPECGAAS